MSSQAASALHGVEAFVFDVFGTTVDWQGNIVRTLAASAEGTEGKCPYNVCLACHAARNNELQLQQKIGMSSLRNGARATSRTRRSTHGFKAGSSLITAGNTLHSLVMEIRTWMLCTGRRVVNTCVCGYRDATRRAFCRYWRRCLSPRDGSTSRPGGTRQSDTS